MTQTYKIADGDIVFDASTGRPHMISDQEKLRQDIDHYTVNSVVNVIGRIDSIVVALIQPSASGSASGPSSTLRSRPPRR